MEQGFIPDMAHSCVWQLAWQRGEPQAAKFLGLANGVKLDTNEQLKVTADRCTKCGLLKLYARASDESAER
jgi:hypothetical protein